jgi:hypothetical protein
MNQSKAQITLKKRLSDKSLIASTLKLLLNDIYWMANDTQLKAAIVAYSAIQKLMKKAFKQKAKLALYKLQVLTVPNYQLEKSTSKFIILFYSKKLM